MAYCLYLRKSRADLDAETRGEGETLARHEKTLLELGKRQNLDITRIYHEIVSGETIAARPVMQRLLAEVERGLWDGVLVMEVERLARGDTIDQGIVAQTFKLSNTRIITPVKTYDPNNEYDEEYFEFGLFMSRREYKTINRRMQRGRIASVKEGKYVGSKPPYGYTRVKLEHDKGFTLKPNPEQAPMIKMIFSLYAYGEVKQDGTTESIGVSKIVRKLNTLGIPAINRNGWADATVRDILGNPVYIGKIRWRSRPLKKKMADGVLVKERPRAKEEDMILADGIHEPLIDQETWKITQQRLKLNSTRPCPQNRKTQNPLSGLVVCGMCGRRMVRRPYHKNNYPEVLLCAATSCKNVSTRLDYVEECVLAILQEWLGTYKLSWEKQISSVSQSDLKERATKSAHNELKRFEKQRDNIYDLLEKGVYTAGVFQERSRSINDKINEVQEQIFRLDAEIQQEKNAERDRPPVLPQTEYVLEQYQKASSAEEKNELLKSVIDRVIYTKTINGRWNKRPDDFELIIFPKIPPALPHH